MTDLIDENPTPDPQSEPAADGRPRFAIGHVPLTGRDIGALADFYASIGFRSVARLPGVAILELRGGTHLAIARGPVGTTTLDLMVDDLDDTRELLTRAGAAPGPVERRFPHRIVEATDPEGNVLVVHSSHVVGTV